jgi:hypothetical protein
VWPPFSNPGRTYKFYTGKPVLPFGYGLSYSRFIYALIPEFSLSRVTRQQRALHVVGHVTVNVTNAGGVDADEVVLGFISPPTGTGRPLKQLFEFTRVHIKAGHTATGAACALVCASVCQCVPVHADFAVSVALPLSAASLSLVDEAGHRYHPCLVFSVELLSMLHCVILTIVTVAIFVALVFNTRAPRYWPTGTHRIRIGVDGAEGTAGQPTPHVLHDLEVE